MKRSNDEKPADGTSKVLSYGSWAIATGVLTCAALCALPIVAALGVGALASPMIRGGGEVLAIALVSGGVLVVGAVLARRAFKRALPSVSAMCGAAERRLAGCMPAGRRSVTALACTVTDGKVARERLAEFKSVFTQGFIGAERAEGVARWRFVARPGFRDELQTLADREQECCPFFRFSITERGNEIIWETRATPEAEPLLAEFSNLALANVADDLSSPGLSTRPPSVRANPG